MNQLRHRMDLARRFHDAKLESYMGKFLKEQINSFDHIQDGKPYLAATFYVPGEIIALFDAEVVFIERMAGFAAANRIISASGVMSLLSGMPACGCSYQALFHSLLADKIIPIPSGFVASSFACDDAWMYCRAAAAKYKIPFYFVDIVQTVEESTVRCAAVQLKAFYKELEGKYRVISSLGEVIAASNKAMAIKEEIDNLRISYPGIMDSMESFKLFTLYNDFGKLPTLQILQDLKSSIQERVKDYKIEKIPRLLWLGMIPLYRNSLLRDMEKRYQCRVVFEELFDFTHQYLTYERFFEDLAKRIVSSPFFSVENRINNILHYVRTLKIDGVVHFSQRNCRFLPPAVPLLRSSLENAGIPFVEMQGDAIYPEYFNETAFWEHLDSFFEMVDGGTGCAR
ncbi:2-hydroxyacyl-CoA dehydratase family protein [Pelosinus baikalensis]|uniref:2-hydroxyacyl-CoA dehydratase family protein n=1 Tax=Pelosinus baikalensis TaxID=2892015 RepID=A0ABS8HTV4_9FIRM|nr:2-hydroxyacyl-CoA dehydratase family protein [Pelosinus baikalensis]MCC5466510.1 2-hydroxyacyl-CoA dehydratase family protein [Pelosinus baikalensis]